MADVLYELDGAVATVTLNRPQRLNTISQPMLSALSEALLAGDANPDVRAIILTGAGKAFCAGLDLQDAASEDGVSKGGFKLAPSLDLRDFPPVVLHQMDTPVILSLIHISEPTRPY